MNVVGDVKGEVCILVDDMIDTGGTIIKAAETLLKEGASKVIACGVHAVLSDNAVSRLNDSPLEEIVVTDTIPQAFNQNSQKFTVLSVAPLFAEAIRRIHSHDSVSSLFV